jgi:hypothetical protein
MAFDCFILNSVTLVLQVFLTARGKTKKKHNIVHIYLEGRWTHFPPLPVCIAKPCGK